MRSFLFREQCGLTLLSPSKARLGGRVEKRPRREREIRGSILFCSILVYSILVQSSLLKAVLSVRVLQPSLSFAVLVHTVPCCCPAMPSLQRRFSSNRSDALCLPPVLVLVCVLLFVGAMCPAHVPFSGRAKSVT